MEIGTSLLVTDNNTVLYDWKAKLANYRYLVCMVNLLPSLSLKVQCYPECIGEVSTRYKSTAAERRPMEVAPLFCCLHCGLQLNSLCDCSICDKMLNVSNLLEKITDAVYIPYSMVKRIFSERMRAWNSLIVCIRWLYPPDCLHALESCSFNYHKQPTGVRISRVT